MLVNHPKMLGKYNYKTIQIKSKYFLVAHGRVLTVEETSRFASSACIQALYWRLFLDKRCILKNVVPATSRPFFFIKGL
jgi:hypothetical protein